jgi:hypothetical protein
MNMKRLAAFSAILILGASLAAAQTASPSTRFSNPLLNDIVRMSKAGMPNDTIIAYTQARQARLDEALTAEDLIELRRAGVGEPVVRYLAGVATFEAPPGGNAPRAQATYESTGGEGETVAVDPGYAGYGYGYPYYGWGWGWPYYGGWWGGPFISGRVFIGGRFGHRGHFIGHGGFHHR